MPKISALTTITGANLADADSFVVVDASDTTQAASGTTKRVTKQELASLFEASGAVSTHAGQADPHTVYLLKVAGGASVENVGAVESNVNTVAASGSTETLDTSTFGVFDVTMDQNCTFTFSNPAPSGKATLFTLILRGAFTPTFPASVDWPDASAPTYSSPSVYTFLTVDAGTTWLGAQAGKAFG